MSSEQSDSCGTHHDNNSPKRMSRTLVSAHLDIRNQSEPISSPTTTAPSSRHKNDLDKSSTTQGEQSKVNLRKGKWTPEEEAYARAVISNFNSGYLDAPVGTTLRAYLSEKLECCKMRVTKKVCIVSFSFHLDQNLGQILLLLPKSLLKMIALEKKYFARLLSTMLELRRR